MGKEPLGLLGLYHVILSRVIEKLLPQYDDGAVGLISWMHNECGISLEDLIKVNVFQPADMVEAAISIIEKEVREQRLNE